MFIFLKCKINVEAPAYVRTTRYAPAHVIIRFAARVIILYQIDH